MAFLIVRTGRPTCCWLSLAARLSLSVKVGRYGVCGCRTTGAARDICNPRKSNLARGSFDQQDRLEYWDRYRHRPEPELEFSAMTVCHLVI